MIVAIIIIEIHKEFVFVYKWIIRWKKISNSMKTVTSASYWNQIAEEAESWGWLLLRPSLSECWTPNPLIQTTKFNKYNAIQLYKAQIKQKLKETKMESAQVIINETMREEFYLDTNSIHLTLALWWHFQGLQAYLPQSCLTLTTVSFFYIILTSNYKVIYIYHLVEVPVQSKGFFPNINYKKIQ